MVVRIAFIGCLVLALLGCKKDLDFGPQYETTPGNDTVPEVSYSAWVLNEGNFTYNNSSLTLIDLDRKQAHQDLFWKANQEKLGDVAQSITVIDSNAWLVINHSAVIYQVSLPDGKKVKTIEGFVSPRYLVPVNDSVAWVSDLGAEKIYELHLTTGVVREKVALEGWVEEMLVQGDYVFACRVKEHEVVVLNRHTGSVVKHIPTGQQPQSFVRDNLGKVWVLCDGGWNIHTRKNARLERIDPDLLEVDYSYEFSDIEDSPTRLRTDKDGKYLYFLNRDVYRLDAQLDAPQPVRWLSSQDQNFYGLGISPDGQTVLVTDAATYTSPGEILHLNAQGELMQTYTAGFIPQHVAFYRNTP